MLRGVDRKSATAVPWGRSLRMVLRSRIFDFVNGAAPSWSSEFRSEAANERAASRTTDSRVEPWLQLRWAGSIGAGRSGRPAAFAHLSTLLARHALPRAVIVTRSADQRRRPTNQGGARAAEMIKLCAFDRCRCRARADQAECRRDSSGRLA